MATAPRSQLASGVWLARGRLADWLTDSLFRRPGGWVARSFYRDAKPHQEAFRDTLAVARPRPRRSPAGGRLWRGHLLGVGDGHRLHGARRSITVQRCSPWRLAATPRAITEGRLELRDADAGDLPFADEEFTAAATINAFFFFNVPAGHAGRGLPDPCTGRADRDPYRRHRAIARRPPHAPLQRWRAAAHARTRRL